MAAAELQHLYSSPTAIKITGATKYHIEAWVTSGVITPTLVGKKKAGYRWSFRDLVQLRTLVQLRQQFNMTVKQLRRISATLKIYGGDFADTYLLVIGEDVMIADGERLISTLKQPGQLSFILYSLESNEREVRAALVVVEAEAA